MLEFFQKSDRMSWEIRLVKQLSLKIRDRNAALADLDEWLESSESRPDLSALQYRYLLNGYLSFFNREWRGNTEKVEARHKPTLNYLNSITLSLKRLVTHVVEKNMFDGLELTFLCCFQSMLKNPSLYGHVYIHLLRTMTKLVHLMKWSVSDDKFEELLTFAIDFINDKCNIEGKQHSPETVEVFKLFSELIATSSRESLLILNSEELLLFIANYVIFCGDTETIGIQFMLPCSWRLLIALDVEGGHMSYQYVSLIFSPLLSYSVSKNLNTKVAAVSLLNLYVKFGTSVHQTVQTDIPYGHSLQMLAQNLYDRYSNEPIAIPIDFLQNVGNPRFFTNLDQLKASVYYEMYLIGDISVSQMDFDGPNYSESVNHGSRLIRGKRFKGDTQHPARNLVLAFLNLDQCIPMAVSVLSMALKRYPPLGKKLLESFGKRLSQIMLSPEFLEHIRYFSSLLLQNGLESLVEWKSTSGTLSNSIGLGTESLVRALIKNSKLSGKQVSEVLKYYLDADYDLSQSQFDLVFDSLHFLDLWDGASIEIVVRKLFDGLVPSKIHLYFNKYSICLTKFISILEGRSDVIDKLEPKVIFTDWQLYGIQLNAIGERIIMFDGKNGDLLCSIFDSNTVKESSTHTIFNFYDPFVNEFKKLVQNWKIELVNSNVSLFVLSICSLLQANSQLEKIIVQDSSWDDFLKLSQSIDSIDLATFPGNVDELEQVISRQNVLNAQFQTVYTRIFNTSKYMHDIKTLKPIESIECSKFPILQNALYGYPGKPDIMGMRNVCAAIAIQSSIFELRIPNYLFEWIRHSIVAKDYNGTLYFSQKWKAIANLMSVDQHEDILEIFIALLDEPSAQGNIFVILPVIEYLKSLYFHRPKVLVDLPVLRIKCQSLINELASKANGMPTSIKIRLCNFFGILVTRSTVVFDLN